MAIWNILCAYNGSSSSDAALNVCILMHQHHQAHVTGLLAHKESNLDTSIRPWMPQKLKKAILDIELEAVQKIRERFFDNVGQTVSPEMLHWISKKGDADYTVAKYAQMFDLTVMGQTESHRVAEEIRLNAGHITSNSGRPVLIVPEKFQIDGIPDRAVLAWDGRRAATRALSDAMQIMEGKKLITVVTVDTGREVAPLEGIDVVEALKRHGVAVERVHLPHEGSTVGETILNYCMSTGANLLIAGAYQHSIFRQDLVGGVTNTLIQKSSIPLLMSH